MTKHQDEIRIPEGLRYRAFLSYRTTDRRQAEWLHGKLESYRVPRALVGTQGEFGEVPPRIGRVFRDRAEARSEADLETFIARELEQSQHLVVLCTPAAAAPESWVGREIAIFRARRPGGGIQAVVGDGVPPACFPPALIGRASDGSATYPLAADVRPRRRGGQDGRRKAVVRIVAALIGVKFDDLWRREQRRRLFTAVFVACLVTIVGLSIALTIAAAATMRRVDASMALSGKAMDAHRWDLAALAAAAAVKQGAWLGPFRSAASVERFRDLRHTGRTAAVLLGHEKALTAAVLSGEGKVAFTASLDGRVHAWDLGRAVGPRQLHRFIGEARELRLTRDGRRLIARGGRRIAVIDVQRRSVITEVRMDGTIKAMSLVRRDGEIALGMLDGTVRLLRGATLEERRVLFKGDAGSPIEAMAADAAGDRLAFADGDGNVYAVELAGGAVRRIAEGNGGVVDHLAFDPTGTFLIVPSDDLAVIYDWRTGSAPARFTWQEHDLVSSEISPSGRHGLSLLSGDVPAIWSFPDGELVADLTVPGCVEKSPFAYECRTSVVSFAPATPAQPERVVAGYWDGTVRIWDVRGKLLGSLSGHVARVSALAVSADGRRLLSASEDHSARLWTLSAAGESVTLRRFCRETDPLLLRLSPLLVGTPLASSAQFDKSREEDVALRRLLQETTLGAPCAE